MKTFKEIQQFENNLLIIDGLNLSFRYKHSKATDFAEDYYRTVRSLQKSYKAKKLVIVSDKGSSKFRKGIYPEYKQNRKDKFDTQTEEERLAFELFFEDYEKTMTYCQDMGIEVLRYQGVEADDLAGYIVKKYSKLFDAVWLASSDKDWDLLLKDNVHRFSYVTRKEYTLENWNDYYDFSHEDYLSVKVIMGDAGDNIKGIEGIGPKRAQELVENWGSVFDIIANAPLPGKYKYIANLNANIGLLSLNHMLVDIESFCEEAIGIDNLDDLNTKLEEYFSL
jgi:5'-3' exonuclease